MKTVLAIALSLMFVMTFESCSTSTKPLTTDETKSNDSSEVSVKVDTISKDSIKTGKE